MEQYRNIFNVYIPEKSCSLKMKRNTMITITYIWPWWVIVFIFKEYIYEFQKDNYIYLFYVFNCFSFYRFSPFYVFRIGDRSICMWFRLLWGNIIWLFLCVNCSYFFNFMPISLSKHKSENPITTRSWNSLIVTFQYISMILVTIHNHFYNKCFLNQITWCFT